MTLSWSCGFVSNATVTKIETFITRNENEIAYFYLDSRSLVTIGVGNLCADEASAAVLALVHINNNQPATDSEKRAEWNRVRAQAISGAPNSHTYSFYAGNAALVLPPNEIKRLLKARLQEFYVELIKIFSGFDSYPEDAKVALFDMIFNLGEGQDTDAKHHRRATGLRQFHTLIDACNRHDWQRAAASCLRRGPSQQRNDDTKALFLACVAGDAVRPMTQAPATPGAPVAATAAPGVDRAPYHQRAPRHHRTVRAPVLRRGSHGADVKAVQRALNRVLAGIMVVRTDGVFGNETLAAVRMAQLRARVPVDGTVGSETRGVLDLVAAA